MVFDPLRKEEIDVSNHSPLLAEDDEGVFVGIFDP